MVGWRSLQRNGFRFQVIAAFRGWGRKCAHIFKFLCLLWTEGEKSRILCGFLSFVYYFLKFIYLTVLGLSCGM